MSAVIATRIGVPTLRKARMQDLPRLAQLQASAARDLSVGYSAEQVAAFVGVHGVTDTRLVRDGTYFVVEMEGEIAGCGGWSCRAQLHGGNDDRQDDTDRLDPAVDAARIRAFFVDPRWARRGLARMLLRRSEAEAHAAGFQRALLEATPAGRPLYVSQGYVEKSAEEIAIEGVPPLVTYRMEKELRAASGPR